MYRHTICHHANAPQGIEDLVETVAERLERQRPGEPWEIVDINGEVLEESHARSKGLLSIEECLAILQKGNT